MLITFRPCGPKDHKVLLKLIVAYYRFDKIAYNLNRSDAALIRFSAIFRLARPG